ncbi:CvpA family protein [Lichenibacterium ramalinae]|uniref:CvpA family protein n=1 Tax=Lichenibacterium ramalinae TaxID=2316527 RepID=A0A4Q2RHM5_9HYPH|nr:CvpA family protein [Lichenibacterium ramalinae]RYB06288.1 CvpA family protein [Lichenibacterium ramalinae]
MPSYLDLALLGIVVVSALLSMVRGFTREVLAIASWGAAAVAAYLLYPRVMPYLEHYIAKDTIRMIAAIAIVFFATLILVSIITVKLSDAILDSKVGALDRTMGFLFGAARGFLLGVVAFLFFNWLVPPKSQPEWVASARSKPLLQATGDEIVAMLPEDPENTFLKRFKRDKPAPSEDLPADADAPGGADTAPAPAQPAAPARRTEAVPGTTPRSAAATPAPTVDRQGLNAILNGTPAAKIPTKKQ